MSPNRYRPHRLAIVVLAIGGVLTVLLAWGASSANSNNEHRLLKLQIRQAASVLSAALPSLQTPLTAAFDVAAATHNPQEFGQSIAPDVGRTGPFVSASLWLITPSAVTPLVVEGVTPSLMSSGRASAFLRHVRAGTTLSVTQFTGGTSPRLGYAEIPPGGGSGEVVYAESPLPADKKAVIPKDSAFSDLDFALYLGRHATASSLLEKTNSGGGYSATASVPFGDTVLTLVGTASEPLGGGLSTSLPWIVGAFGALLALSAATTTEYLVRRRTLAESLAAENATLYIEQRTISETLQRALLPAEIPTLAGLDIAVRYVPGVGGIEVGGDWYDVIPTGAGSAILVVGDVSGRGLSAATTMAYLRHAIWAYVAQGGGPAVVLQKLGDLVGGGADGHFATVLCASIDVGRRHMTVASAGHFAPLVLDQTGASFIDVPVAPPIGVMPRRPATEVSLTLGPGACVLAFTDGLVERRDEDIDVGLERIRRAASGRTVAVDSLLGRLLVDLTPEGSDDDIAILGVQWQA